MRGSHSVAFGAFTIKDVIARFSRKVSINGGGPLSGVILPHGIPAE